MKYFKDIFLKGVIEQVPENARLDGGCRGNEISSKVIWNNSRGEENSIDLTFASNGKEYVISEISFTVNEGKKAITQTKAYLLK